MDIFRKKNCSQSKPSHISHQLKKQADRECLWCHEEYLNVSISSAVMDLWFTPYSDFTKYHLPSSNGTWQRSKGTMKIWKKIKASVASRNCRPLHQFHLTNWDFWWSFLKASINQVGSIDFCPSKPITLPPRIMEVANYPKMKGNAHFPLPWLWEEEKTTTGPTTSPTTVPLRIEELPFYKLALPELGSLVSWWISILFNGLRFPMFFC